MIAQLREAVRGPVERRVVVLPHLDLLTTSQGGLTAEAREVIPAPLRKPRAGLARLQGSLVPACRKVIENLFPHRDQPAGHRPRLGCDTWSRARRAASSAASSIPGRSTSTSPASTRCGCASCSPRWRARTIPPTRECLIANSARPRLAARLEVPNVDLDSDIGGYVKVKNALQQRNPRRAGAQGRN